MGWSALVAAGALAAWRWWRAGVLYLACGGALLAVWPWAIGRFLMPLLLVLVPLLLLGALAIAGRRTRVGWAMVTILTVVLGFSAGTKSWAAVDARNQCGRSSDWPPAACLSGQKAGYFTALRYVRDSLPADAVFLAAKYAPLYHYTGRRSVSYRSALARDSTALLGYLRAERATHVMLGSLERSEPTRLAPALRGIWPGNFTLEARVSQRRVEVPSVVR